MNCWTKHPGVKQSPSEGTHLVIFTGSQGTRSDKIVMAPNAIGSLSLLTPQYLLNTTQHQWVTDPQLLIHTAAQLLVLANAQLFVLAAPDLSLSAARPMPSALLSNRRPPALHSSFVSSLQNGTAYAAGLQSGSAFITGYPLDLLSPSVLPVCHSQFSYWPVGISGGGAVCTTTCEILY